MPRESADVDAARSENPGVRAEIAYLPLPEYLHRPSGWLFITLALGIPALMIVSGLLRQSGRTTSGWRVTMTMGIILVVFVGILMTVLIVVAARRRAQRAREAQARHVDPHEPEQRDGQLLRRLVELDLEQPNVVWSKSGRWTWADLCDGFASPQATLPRCLAEEFRRSALERIERPDHMLEPESIAAGAASTQSGMGLLLGFMGLGWLMTVAASPWRISAIWFPIFAAFMLAGLPAVRRRLPWVTDRARLPVAGLGFIRDHKSRTWTIHDALMLVTAKNSASHIWVYIVGQVGWLRFAFADETDPEFIKLWQRWNHPHPRPELLD